MAATQHNPKIIVCTDLDGTLLDAHTYRWDAAIPALDALKERGFPVVLNSSKTFAELIKLAQKLGTDAPLVAENGSILATPVPLIGDVEKSPLRKSGYQIEHLGLDRRTVTAAAHGLRQRYDYHFAGFADWDAETIADHTALSLEDATSAAERLATEPIIWHDSQARWREFEQAIRDVGIKAVRGGRFIHLMGDIDKGTCLSRLRRIYATSTDPHPTIVGLGDAPNDLDMLSAADIAVVIPSVHGHSLAPTATRTIWPTEAGPAGWNAAILQILNEMEN